jgi:hypothetical protein
MSNRGPKLPKEKRETRAPQSNIQSHPTRTKRWWKLPLEIFFRVGPVEGITLGSDPSFEINTDPEPNRDYVSMTIHYSTKLQNFGRSVAHEEYENFHGYFDKGNPFVHWFDWCDAWAVYQYLPRETHRAIFPNEQRIVKGDVPIQLDMSNKIENVMLVGCVVYRDNSGKVRQTSILYKPIYGNDAPRSVIPKPPIEYRPIKEFQIADTKAD